MLQWRREIPRKNVAATAAEKLLELDPLFQDNSDNSGICFEMVAIFLRLRLHFDFDIDLMEVGVGNQSIRFDLRSEVSWSFQRMFLRQVEVGNYKRSMSNHEISMMNSHPVSERIKNFSTV